MKPKDWLAFTWMGKMPAPYLLYITVRMETGLKRIRNNAFHIKFIYISKCYI